VEIPKPDRDLLTHAERERLEQTFVFGSKVIPGFPEVTVGLSSYRDSL